jgi:hypothetical protein
MHKRFIGGLLLLCTLLIAACGGTTLTPPEPQPTPENTPAEGGEIVTPSNPTPEEGELEPRGIEDVTNVTALVLEQLAATTGLDRESFTVGDVTEQEWPDAGLGCPAPGEVYIQTITPGYQFTVEGGDETFDVRTNSDGSLIIICDATGVPLGLDEEGNDVGAVEMPELPEELATIPQQIADAMGFEASDLTLATLEEVEWNDSSLGCPSLDPATSYMQVITPGYQMAFETPDGEAIDVRASRDGYFVICGPDGQPMTIE